MSFWPKSLVSVNHETEDLHIAKVTYFPHGSIDPTFHVANSVCTDKYRLYWQQITDTDISC